MKILSKEKRQLLVRVAQLRLDGLTEAQIGQKLDPKRGQPAVAKLLEEVKEYRLVRYEIDADAAITGNRDQELSNDLRKAFELESAHAIKVAEDLDNDELHVALANYTAENVRP